MYFYKRAHAVADAAPEGATLEEAARILAKKIKGTSWCGCVGFRIGEWLFLNDSASTGPQEWGIVHEPTLRQVESITFGWCKSIEEVESYILRVLRGEFQTKYGTVDRDLIETPKQHGRCPLCE